MCVLLIPADVFAWLLLPGEHRASARMWVTQAHLNNMSTTGVRIQTWFVEFESQSILNHIFNHLEVSSLSVLSEQKPCWAEGGQEKYGGVEGLVLVETHCITDCVPPDSFPKHPAAAE